MIRKNHTSKGTTYSARIGDGPERTFKRRKDAEEYEEQQRKARRRARAGLDYEAGPIKYEDLCVLFLQGYDAKSKPWTEQMLVHSRTKFGDQFVRAIQPEHIGAWLHSLDCSSKTKRHILERMQTVMKAGVEWGYLSRSPARGRAVRPPADSRATDVLPFESWAEVKAIATAAGKYREDFARAIIFAAGTGLRPGEWTRITHGNIDRKNRWVSVPGTKNRNAQRSVPLMQRVADNLGPRGLPHTRLFHINYHRFRNHWWIKALNDVGLEQRPPGQLRHTFATLALQQGIPLDIVSSWMGHESVDVTKRYYARYTRPVIDRNLALLDSLADEETEGKENAQ